MESKKYFETETRVELKEFSLFQRSTHHHARAWCDDRAPPVCRHMTKDDDMRFHFATIMYKNAIHASCSGSET